MRRKTILLSMLMVSAALVPAGCAKSEDGGSDVKNDVNISEAVISDSYDNTDELIKKFPVINPTPVNTELEKNIQNRLLNGFENWNRGYDTWKAWGDILYTKDSIYNLHGVRLTLEEYQESQNIGLKSSDIQMGNFNNMIICGDWTAIRYDISTTNRSTGETKDGSVMEFVNFKDYGGDMGTRVVEGWAGTKGADFEMLSGFQTDEEKVSQQKAAEEILNMSIPDTDKLEEKYPVKYPTPHYGTKAEEIQNAVLKDFDNWNKGYDAWETWADSYYSNEFEYNTDSGTQSIEEYKGSVKEQFETTDVKRVYFDNMLISGEWAAVHYRIIAEDKETGVKTAGDVMQFLHFDISGDEIKVKECWTE